MTINLITYASGLDKLTTTTKIHEKTLAELEIQFEVKYFNPTEIEHIPKENLSILFVASGGVEQQIAKDIERLPRPIILLADGLQNSLAAALEVSSWLRERGIKNEILHGDIFDIKKRIVHLGINYNVQNQLKTQRIGVFGTPAPWAIASGVDYFLAKQRWGVEFVNIPLMRLYELYNQITDEEVSTLCTNFSSTAYSSQEITPKALVKSMKLYKAIRQICEEEQLTGTTLNCYKTLAELGVTGCVANSLLNNEGIVSGCEGDLQTIFTLIMSRSLTRQTGFMCNPNKIDFKENKLILGHCSIGTQQTSHFILRNHFSGKDTITIQGLLPLGEYTLIKCGGECLDKYFVSSGYLLDNTETESSSRTEVLFKMNESADYFLRNPLGNHHVMVRGNHESLFKSFLEAHSCKRIQ